MLTDDEKSAVVKRKLEGGSGNQGRADYNKNMISGEEVIDAGMWPLSVGEAELLVDAIRNGTKYWLRSPGNSNGNAAIFNVTYIDSSGESVTENISVRPAFNLKLSSIKLTSAAEGGKASGDVGAGALTKVGSYDGSKGWELTLLDGSRNFSAQRTDSGYVTAGSDISISYSGATVGNNEYVSAILLNSSGMRFCIMAVLQTRAQVRTVATQS
ncbi:MAG: hypothetical protein K6B28_05710 [Lachnospiraceae bacterium]|nr:hypothetical protein [Lachnospiraceae bacterium]